MSDKILKERVRRLLDERGVKYQLTVVTKGELFTVSTNDEYYFILVRDNDAGIEMWSQYFTPEQAIAATVGKDIEHYDGSRRRGTVAILQGGRKPEEVMFVAEDGGVTHYLPAGAGTCEWCKDGKTFDRQTVMMTNHGWQKIRHCPNCGRKIGEESA